MIAGRAGRIVAAVGMVFAAAGLSVCGPSAGAEETILATGSYWRAFAMCRTAVVPLELLKAKDPTATAAKPVGQQLHTAAPPANWAATDFDDSAWPRMTGPFAGEPREWTRRNAGPGRATVCLRGKFSVPDPAKARGLALELSYSGGVIVSVNGREVLRKHVAEGKITPETPAEPFPVEAYVDAAGRILPTRRIKAAGDETKRRLRLRTGRRATVGIPPGLLRQGTNVLAIEVRRAAFRPEAVSAMKRNTSWTHLALWSVRLTAGGGVTPNVARPAGLQVWNADPHEILFAGSYGEANDALRPIRLTGPRNGECSAQVVVSRDAAVEGLRAVASDLTADGGKGAIAAANVHVRYAALGTLDRTVRRTGLGLGYGSWERIPAFSFVADAPPEKVEPVTLRAEPRLREPLGLPRQARPGAVQPVWITIAVPTSAAPGRYTGTLTVAARGLEPVKVPVELTVADWALPETKDFLTVVSLYQSAETLAAQYGVPMWSEKHFALLERSWKLAGWLGNSALVVPLINETMFGNEDTWVPWTRGPDGAFGYDFTAYRRMVKLARKHCRLRFISYQVYRPKGWTPPAASAPNMVTVVDAAGKKSVLALPAYGTAESKKLWKPMLAALAAENKALGLGEDVTLVLGIGQDGGVHKTVVDQFKQLWPGVKWHYGAHNRPSRRRGGRTPYDFGEYLYVPGNIPAPAGRRYGWQEPMCILMSQRFHDSWQGIMTVHTMAERAMLIGDDGPGRFCLDYWPLKGMRKGSHQGTMFSRWPASSADQRTPHLKRLSYPGPNGALPSIKALMFRMGLQEAEARQRIERALLAGKIRPAKAARCREVLDDRAAYLRLYHAQRPFLYASGGGWLKLSERLYRAAAEVAAEMK